MGWKTLRATVRSKGAAVGKGIFYGKWCGKQVWGETYEKGRISYLHGKTTREMRSCWQASSCRRAGAVQFRALSSGSR